MAPFWINFQGPVLAQGDYLPECLVPTFDPKFGSEGETERIPVRHGSLIVVTQSCDLLNAKAKLVALCPIFTLDQFEAINSNFKTKGVWEAVRKGRREGLHMLAGTVNPENNRSAFVVDFRQIYSLPFEYLSSHAEQVGTRNRLQSPFVEHFSQAFARFFMRVGLPSSIPPFQ